MSDACLCSFPAALTCLILRANVWPDREACTARILQRDPDGVPVAKMNGRQRAHLHQTGPQCPHITTQPILTHHPGSMVIVVLHVKGCAHVSKHLITVTLAHAAGKSWPARCGVEPGRQEPTATLSAAILVLQMISMLQACCWPTWPSSPSVNQAALMAHLYRGQPTLCTFPHSGLPSFVSKNLDSKKYCTLC